MRFTKPITIATAKAVAAGNSGHQEDVIVAANMGRKAIFDLLRACKVRFSLEFQMTNLIYEFCFIQMKLPYSLTQTSIDCTFRSISEF